jgi:hypothetical protein
MLCVCLVVDTQMPNLDGVPKKTALLGNQAAALSSRFASSGAGQNKFM